MTLEVPKKKPDDSLPEGNQGPSSGGGGLCLAGLDRVQQGSSLGLEFCEVLHLFAVQTLEQPLACRGEVAQSVVQEPLADECVNRPDRCAGLGEQLVLPDCVLE